LVAAFVVVAFFAELATPAPRAISARLIEIGITAQFALEAVLVAALIVVLPRMAKFGLRELGFAWPNGSALGIALLGAIVMTIVSDGSSALIEHATHTTHSQESIAIFKALHDRTAVAIFAFFAIIAAPIAEETIFRGLFFNVGLRYGGFWTGVIFSSILFGLAHGDLYEAIPLALGGAILCWVYYSSRNIVAPMISHGLFNAVTIVALIAAPKLVSP
jgi:membrane protease YdiL (CAAX protease family)